MSPRGSGILAIAFMACIPAFIWVLSNLEPARRTADSELVVFSLLGDRVLDVRGSDCWSGDHRAEITRADGVRYRITVATGIAVCARRP